MVHCYLWQVINNQGNILKVIAIRLGGLEFPVAHIQAFKYSRTAFFCPGLSVSLPSNSSWGVGKLIKCSFNSASVTSIQHNLRFASGFLTGFPCCWRKWFCLPMSLPKVKPLTQQISILFHWVTFNWFQNFPKIEESEETILNYF